MESLAHFWDELDDVAGACRHLATAAIAETLAAASGMLLACAGALLLAREHLARLTA